VSIIKNNKMKKIIIIGIIIITTLSCNAQQIIPIEKIIDYRRTETGLPEGLIYLKDVNNLLDKYVGIWKGTYDSKKYEFRITKFTETRERVKEDILLIRYIITEANGTEIENTTMLPDNNYLVVRGDYIDRSSYLLTYIGKKGNCGQSGTIFISTSIKSNYNQMLLSLEPEQMLISAKDCPNGRAQQIIPHEQIILSKE
jgi:hypothetical protein